MLLLYSAELTAEAAQKAFFCLPDISREKLKNRRREGDVAGELLRLHMMEACGAPPDFALGAHGKPYSPGRPDISYNISHSRGLAVGALLTGSAGEVGVDVEFVDRENVRRHGRIAERFFSERERAELSRAEDAALAFYLLWTRKESYLKYTCTGFDAVDAFSAEPESGVLTRSRVIRGEDGSEYAFSVTAEEGAFDNDDIIIRKIKF